MIDSTYLKVEPPHKDLHLQLDLYNAGALGSAKASSSMAAQPHDADCPTALNEQVQQTHVH